MFECRSTRGACCTEAGFSRLWYQGVLYFRTFQNLRGTRKLYMAMNLIPNPGNVQWFYYFAK